MKHSTLLLCLALCGCGVGSDPAPAAKTMAVRLDANTVLPSPFVLGPSGTMPVPFTVGPQPQVPVVTFVTGPVTGPVAVVNPTIIAVNQTTPNWCTDGFVIGPCTPRCEPNQFTTGPCP